MDWNFVNGGESKTIVDADSGFLGVGIGLRTVHFNEILKKPPPIDWFEIISENFMRTSGRPSFILDFISERYPVVMHGVSGSIGSCDPIDWKYFKLLKQLARRCKARWVSDHLCWTGVSGRNTHDLLPLPYNEDSLKHVAGRLDQIQDYLGMQYTIENPSSYVEFKSSTISECEFLKELANETGCGLLLDINNVVVPFDLGKWNNN